MGTLVVSTSEAALAVPTPQPAQPRQAAQAKPLAERPDRVSAALSARLQGTRVLVSGETTETSLTYANPDGTLTLEASSGPVRVKEGDSWAPIDTTLVEAGGVLRPKAALGGVEFSAGGESRPLAKLAPSGKQSYALGWPAALPQPKVEGNTATYPDAAGPGADLVLTALPAGFRHDVVLRQRPSGPVEYRIPIRTEGLTLAKTRRGELNLSDAKGRIVASAPEPVMYDSPATETGTIETTVVTGGDDQALVLKPDAKFLADPDTTYPVTVDPATTIPVLTDVTAFSDGGFNQSIQVGTSDSGNTRTFQRALLRFDTSTLAGQAVTDARLDLQSNGGWGCVTGQTVKAQRITAAWSDRFPNFNVATTTDGEQLAREPGACTGNGSIPHGAWTWNITDIARSWASGAGAHGVMLRLVTESPTPFTNQYDRGFDASEDAATGGVPPKLIVTFGSTPATGKLRVAPVTTGLDGVVYTSTTTPTLVADVKDPDGGVLRAEYEIERDPDANQGTGQLWTGSVDGVASGTEAKVSVPAGRLLDGQKFRWRARAFDGTSYSAWSVWQKTAIDASAPAAPTITCEVRPDTWYPRVNGEQQSQSCSISGLKGNNAYLWTIDDPYAYHVNKLSRIDSEVNDSQQLAIPPLDDGWHTLYVKTRDNAHNTSAVASFNFGIGPGGLVSPKHNSRTQRATSLVGAAPSGRTGIRYEYRGTGRAGSTAFTPVPPADVTVPGSGQPVPAWPQTRTDTAKDFPELSWDVAKTLQAASIPDGTIELRACLSGGGEAEACSKPIDVILDRSAFGGSYAIADVGPGKVALQSGDFALSSTDASLFGIAVSRTATTLNPAADRADEQLAENKVFGPGWRAGFPTVASGIEEFSPTSAGENGSLQLVGADGSTLSYVKDGTSFVGVGDAANGSRIAATSEELTITESTGSKTTYTKANNKWVVARTGTTAAESAITYYRDTQGRVTRVLAPVTAGVTCGSVLAPGCRALELSYAAATTATGVDSGWGDFKDQVKSVSFTAFDPGSNAMKTTVLTTYQYDSTGRLRQVTDPRSTISTVYAYSAEGRISQITPVGLAPWRIDYDARGRLAHVARENGATDPTWAVAYDVPIGGAGAPVDLTLAKTATWGQASGLPVTGTAIFPASHTPPRVPNGAYAPGSGDWARAQIFYTDVNGRAVDHAAYGAGGWQVAATRYDDRGNVVWKLSAANRAQALTPGPQTDPYVAARADSAQRAHLLATVNTYNARSALLTSEGPTHPVTLAAGTVVSARQRTSNVYDEGKPDSGKEYGLLTTLRAEPAVVDDGASPSASDVRIAKRGYDPVQSGDTSGWDLRLATTESVLVNEQSSLTKKVRYNAAGREIERRLPKSAGADAGTTVTSYYTAGTHPSVPACGDKAAWAGMVCRSGPGSQPTGAPLPVTTTAYAYYGQSAVVTQVSGPTTRTKTVGFDQAGRPKTTKITVIPEADGGTSVPESTVVYEPQTGLQTEVSTPAAKVTTTYDTFGRVSTSVDADGNTSTLTYTIDGQTSTISDGKGTTTYTYGTASDGQAESRGLPTKIESTGVGTFTASYDADGRLTQQTYPGGLTATLRHDNAGQATGMSYGKAGATWLGFSQSVDTIGNTVKDVSPAGSQSYGYDLAGRLTSVQDQAAGRCTTRQYQFDDNTNRTSLKTYPGESNGTCSTTTTPQVRNSSYDQADRSNGGHVFDNLGRTTQIPAADVEGGTDLKIGYHADDMVASLTQDTQTRTFSIDPLGRIRAMTSVGGPRPGTLINHYAGSGDSPAWISEASGGWTRNVAGFIGLGAIQSSDGKVTLQLANLHGDVVATVDAAATGSGVDAYFEQTEYGAPRDLAAPNPSRYGWLGAHQRSGDALAGIILMGARLYNPATGRFLQMDPIIGGSANAYEYCFGDPVNCNDLDGKAGCPWLCQIGFFALEQAIGLACVGTGVLFVACKGFVGGVVGVAKQLLTCEKNCNADLMVVFWANFVKSAAGSIAVAGIFIPKILNLIYKHLSPSVIGKIQPLINFLQGLMNKLNPPKASGGMSIPAKEIQQAIIDYQCMTGPCGKSTGGWPSMLFYYKAGLGFDPS
ncbi:RHS repeat-associated core domain-containing protein [Nonomuraea sp. NPDC050540]|uniref:RHS repeat-associated core domain-containing protein n=1 Tax=Nonomuraea sp. NPDC050540 TaxID=3364367 RepID=UPI003789A675